MITSELLLDYNELGHDDGIGELMDSLEELVGEDFAHDELFEKLTTNDSFMAFAYNYVMVISHSKRERKELVARHGDNLIMWIPPSDLAWGIVKYMDNIDMWNSQLQRKVKAREAAAAKEKGDKKR